MIGKRKRFSLIEEKGERSQDKHVATIMSACRVNACACLIYTNESPIQRC
jgi:hypothetical protein